MELKESTVYEEQLTLIKKKGFIIPINEEQFAEKVRSCINENKNTLVVKHHNNKYKGKFPIWVIIDFFSMGMLSYFFKDMKTEDKKIIAANLYETSPKQLENSLHNC